MLELAGKTVTSPEFANLLHDRWLVEGGNKVSFYIGGAEGLPRSMQKGGSHAGTYSISLGEMTYTHQMARLLLSEQIYRATQIREGTGYHK